MAVPPTSDPLRSLSTSSSSPRRPQTISRPEWPWSARTYAQRNAQSSTTSSTPTSQVGWDRTSIPGHNAVMNTTLSRGTPTPRLSSQSAYSSMQSEQGESTRQWSITGFEWAIKDVTKLREFVEGISSGEGQNTLTADDFDLLKQSPLLGDNKYKLEVALTSPSEGAGRSLLSLYLTSLCMDYPHRDMETPATMMAGIKSQEDRLGERGARPDWIWEFWQNDWVFRQESEVWECPLPALSDLLENPRIRQTDSFVICLQIHSPSGPAIPQQPSVSYVPRDLLDGLEASLDNPNTGDIRFVCLERLAPDGDIPTSGSTISRHSSLSTASHQAFSSQITARKRIIYAHSDILVRRSEYFATMLSSSFSESSSLIPGERKVHTIVVEEADFETMYWLLKFCYADWLLFKQNDDPRAAVEGVGAGWSAKWLNSRENEWDWKTFYKAVPGDDHFLDSRSVTSIGSIEPSSTVSSSTSKKSPVPDDGTTTASSGHSAKTTGSKTGANPKQSNVPVARFNAPSGTTIGHRPKNAPVSIPTTGFSASSSHPRSPRAPRQMPPAVPDPHPHPTSPPPPASALAMYQVAHRYAMGRLGSLALEHIMTTITPQSCFPLLLASYTWDDLYSLVEDYVIDKWDEVSASADFESCCKEIAAGEWGSEGGNTLTSVFRRLRSPTSVPT
ncbi:hypothetical protein FA15DRAFT_664954 [Coprinopsis marcescibilis]|uniref:BTB domain-containing protein n=1 Tax=Coprinopsis marcescibilis TaxID=230819 RepID=A0A5C3L7Z2_COPMA|nr:hypothetical protein FA15DRAFT_664954 [Coprinopsis marcescibilis]